MPHVVREPTFTVNFSASAEQPAANTIPLMRPRLPGVARIAPYIQQIDANRWYSNFGPLVCSFEDRLAAHYDSDPGSVLAVANGTLGLTLALQGVAPLPGDLCMLPAFTFSASASAVIAAGLVPWFVDVDPESWALEPSLARDYLRDAPGRVAAVMPVSVFGRPLEVAPWDKFTAETGIPAVIDGAASFDAARVGQSPVMISLHATKVFGVGEGGLILTQDKELLARIRSLSSFGFSLEQEKNTDGRAALLPGFNGKLSEYSAAVGLAGLDEWTATRRRFLEIRDEYLWVMADLPAVRPQPGGHEPWASATINFETPHKSAKSLVDALARSGIQARRWWGDGCHSAPAFAACPRGPLPVTDRLIDSVIGLPFYLDITRDDILAVKDAIARLIR